MFGPICSRCSAVLRCAAYRILFPSADEMSPTAMLTVISLPSGPANCGFTSTRSMEVNIPKHGSTQAHINTHERKQQRKQGTRTRQSTTSADEDVVLHAISHTCAWCLVRVLWLLLSCCCCVYLLLLLLHICSMLHDTSSHQRHVFRWTERTADPQSLTKHMQDTHKHTARTARTHGRTDGRKQGGTVTYGNMECRTSNIKRQHARTNNK